MGLCFSCINQGSVGLIETCGRFSREEDPGCFCLIPCVQTLAYTVDVRQQQMYVTVDTKTKDDVFCKVQVAIIYSVNRNNVQNYVYEIRNPGAMIDSTVQNVVRRVLCNISLDEAFSEKEEMSNEVKMQLTNEYSKYGFNFANIMINDIEPEAKIRSAMNEKQTQARLRQAAVDQAEAKKFTLIAEAEANAEASIKNAEADAKVKILAGKGIAGQRIEIAAGFGQSIEEIKRLNPELSESMITEMIQNMLYIDMLKAVGGASKSNLVFLPANNEVSSKDIMMPSLLKNNS
jgi:regulator of protease activity HflC (stomatin/prohibitin superfamily)